jgi:hypothetical protein
MKTTTYSWTKNLAALLLSCCLAVALATPTAALARSRVAIDSPDATGSRASTLATARAQPRAWSPLARWMSWFFYW